MKKFGKMALAVAAVSALVSLQSTGSASAAEAIIDVPLEVAYIDHAVAEAHGFKVIEGDDGVEVSVPQTEAAKALIGRQSRHTVVGNCGSATLNMSRVGGASKVMVTTGFKVRLPTIYHTWNVDLKRGGGAWGVPLSGGPTSGAWATSRIVNTGNNQSVHGLVRGGSHTLLVDGSVCFAGGPNSWT